MTLITRYGADKIAHHLPGHIKAVREAGIEVIWVCDPMHGKCVNAPIILPCDFLNALSTLTSSSGLKTRNFATIISEINSCLGLHEKNGSRLGGISLEFTGELSEDGYSVTECLGGSMELSEEQLGLRYQVNCSGLARLASELTTIKSFCDPRLNFEQSLGIPLLSADPNVISCAADLAFLISNHFKQERDHHSKEDVLFSELGGR